MSGFRRALDEISGLFVDDGVLAIAAVGWIAVTALVLPSIIASEIARAILLFAGLATALVGSTVRRARARH